MVAHKSGLGVALRNLAFLEIDIHNNWRPFRPQLGYVLDPATNELALEVSWKDPLAILYLIPVPTELQLHYGIEIENDAASERVVEIIGYQESRYFRQIWHYHHHGSADSGGSTLTLDPEPGSQRESNPEPFVYRELFGNIHPTANNGTIKVSICMVLNCVKTNQFFGMPLRYPFGPLSMVN